MTAAITTKENDTEKITLTTQNLTSMKPLENQQLPKINTNYFKLVGDDSRPSFCREFATLKALRQFQQRNPYIVETTNEYILINNIWERFVVFGSQVIPKSTLQTLLNSINDDPQPSLNPD